ncbi:hypothetical protein ACFQAT_05280 [Undibacterium arcticum]|uniref:hypothetical protein n=1 Tax=Undibacterium arcticum TaxID=1762892 RepID=UPI0036085182
MLDVDRGGADPAPPVSNRTTRRTVLKAGGTLLLAVIAPALLPNLAHAAQILAVRVWPADDYTRVTLETTAT